ncbi:MAG: histidinol-phosphate transaminase [Steroidobacteraceae bacterium]
MNDVLALARPEIRDLKPYSHAAWDPACVRLHANENPWSDHSDMEAVRLNRYPEPQPRELHAALAAYCGTSPDRVLACRGSDEAIDLLVRVFCCAGQDGVMICPPTFAMYGFAAAVQGAAVVEVPLAVDFGLDAEAVLRIWTPDVKIVFLCSPNNPTGNLLDAGALQRVLVGLSGRALVVVDEAYFEFSHASGAADVSSHPHLVALRTLSKAHGLAGARCGAVFAAPEIIGLLSRIIAPYALPAPTIEAALMALTPERLARMQDRVRQLRAERERLCEALGRLPCVRKVWPSEANFLLVHFEDAARAFAAALASGLLLRDFSTRPRLEGCLRITVGAPAENDRLIACLGAA